MCVFAERRDVIKYHWIWREQTQRGFQRNFHQFDERITLGIALQECYAHFGSVRDVARSMDIIAL